VTSSGSPRALLVLTTLPADVDATALARRLVEAQLGACVNVLAPMTSIYRWQGAVAQDREQQLLIKTAPHRLHALRAWLLANHPYETPEFLVIDATGSENYLHWIGDSTGRG
jgi:periplasmic divalent cation tolerance protein